MLAQCVLLGGSGCPYSSVASGEGSKIGMVNVRRCRLE